MHWVNVAAMYTEGEETMRQELQQEERARERENILCERKDKICADRFLARGLEH